MESLLALDRDLFRWLYDLDVPRFLVVSITHLATWGGVWVGVALALVVLGRGQTRRTGLAVAAGLAAQLLLIEQGLKHLVARQRPFATMGLELRDGLLDAGSYSFPSGHSMASFLAAWIVTVRFPRWRIPLLALAVLIGLSRVHLGAHYPGDVLAGAVLGILFGTTIARLLRLEAVRPLAQVPACAEGTDG